MILRATEKTRNSLEGGKIISVYFVLLIHIAARQISVKLY